MKGAASILARLRSYLKKNAVETWEYVHWLTHAKNAIRLDAEIGLKAVEHLLGVFTAARLRHGEATHAERELSFVRPLRRNLPTLWCGRPVRSAAAAEGTLASSARTSRR